MWSSAVQPPRARWVVLCHVLVVEEVLGYLYLYDYIITATTSDHAEFHHADIHQMVDAS